MINWVLWFFFMFFLSIPIVFHIMDICPFVVWYIIRLQQHLEILEEHLNFNAVFFFSAFFSDTTGLNLAIAAYS